MLRRTKNGNYIILKDDDIYPYEIDKEKLDEFFKYFISMTDDFNELLKVTPPDIKEYIFYNTGLRYIDIFETYMESYRNPFEEISAEFKELWGFLKSGDDEIPIPEERMTLEDLGFSNQPWHDYKFYEKMLEDTDEREVVEEVLLTDEKLYHRKRTTNWEKTDYGKSSTSIVYEDLPISEELQIVIDNTFAG